MYDPGQPKESSGGYVEDWEIISQDTKLPAERPEYIEEWYWQRITEADAKVGADHLRARERDIAETRAHNLSIIIRNSLEGGTSFAVIADEYGGIAELERCIGTELIRHFKDWMPTPRGVIKPVNGAPCQKKNPFKNRRRGDYT